MTPLQRAEDLHEKSFMPWSDAFELALNEIGIGDAEIDELTSEASPTLVTTLLNKEDMREFVRAILVLQHGIKSNAD